MKVGTLPNDDDSCGWYHSLPPPPPATPLAGAHRFDHVVLGAGFAGLAAARQLAHHFPDREVALVDAQRVGYGASGRNSGFVIDLPHSFADADHGSAMARDRAEMRLNGFAIDTLQNLVETHGIACQWGARGKYHAAVEDERRAQWSANRRAEHPPPPEYHPHPGTGDHRANIYGRPSSYNFQLFTELGIA